MPSEPYDLIVIGGGTSGIAAARFYLDIHEDTKLVILERDACVGGVWGKDRVYDGFLSQASPHMGGFSDVAFKPPPDKVNKDNFYHASVMADYLEDYIDSHVYAGKSLRDRVLFNTTVQALNKTEQGRWEVTYSLTTSTPTKAHSVLTASKVIIATGETSQPNIPHLKGQESFTGRIEHTMTIASSSVLKSPTVRTVTVLGAGSSAIDHVYQAVKAGKQVTWIIRKSGKGPGGFISGKGAGPYKNVTDMSLTRFMSGLIPGGLGPNNRWEGFWVRSVVGKWLFRRFMGIAATQVNAGADFEGREKRGEKVKRGFSELRSDMDPLFLSQTPVGIIHHDDFWDMVAHHVDVHRADITALDGEGVHLDTGDIIQTDALLLGTGWKTAIPFLTPEQLAHLGLPHSKASPSSAGLPSAEWERLEESHRSSILARFPFLKTPPPTLEHPGDAVTGETPFRLYNTIAPLTEKTLCFVGFSSLPNMFMGSEIESIWATAYLDGHLDSRLPDLEGRRDIVAWTNMYMRLRCPTYGLLGNFYLFDTFGYLDKLMGEVGLTGYQRGLFRTLTAADFRGLKDEYVKLYGKD